MEKRGEERRRQTTLFSSWLRVYRGESLQYWLKQWMAPSRGTHCVQTRRRRAMRRSWELSRHEDDAGWSFWISSMTKGTPLDPTFHCQFKNFQRHTQFSQRAPSLSPSFIHPAVLFDFAHEAHPQSFRTSLCHSIPHYSEYNSRVLRQSSHSFLFNYTFVQPLQKKWKPDVLSNYRPFPSYISLPRFKKRFSPLVTSPLI